MQEAAQRLDRRWERARRTLRYRRLRQAGRAGRRRGQATVKAHPHMLRHACGFALANAGHDTRALQAYFGHRNIQHTVRYTELA
jgi:site-specific recombinase XerD